MATPRTSRHSRFRILGPLEIRGGGEAEPSVGGAKPKAILIRLLLEPNTFVSTDRLVDAAWEDRAPSDAVKNVQIYIARMRKVLPEGLIQSGSNGYAVTCGPNDVDAGLYERLVTDARAGAAVGQADEAIASYSRAEGLWRGEVLTDVRYATFAQTYISYYEQLRAAAHDEEIALRLELGEGPEQLARIQALVVEAPLRERRWAHLMTALYQAGRHAEALRAYQDLRTMFAEEMGLEPSPELEALELRILDHDPALFGSVAEPRQPMVTVEGLGAKLSVVVGHVDGSAEPSVLVETGDGPEVVDTAYSAVSEAPGLAAAIVPLSRPAAGDGLARRMIAAARVGEVLLSQDAHSLLSGCGADMSRFSPVGWLDLGSGIHTAYYKLRQLRVPEEMVPVRGNLTHYRNAFLGRSNEMEAVESALGEAPVVTIAGPGGIGKTRLASEVAERAADRYSDGAWLVDLGGVSHADAVALKVAETIGSAASDSIGIADTLSGRPSLLILDNCEQATAAVRHLVGRLVADSAGTSVIATSRMPLGLAGERLVRLRALDWMTGNEPAPAVELFRVRADELGTGVEAPDHLLAKLCELAGGIPLAIELAVAQLGHLTFPQLLARMDDQLSILAMPGRSSRHRSIRAVFELSFGLLTDEARMLLMQSSVFRGGFDRSDLVALVGRADIEDPLRELVTASLYSANSRDGASMRYRLLEPIRQYAHEQLAELDLVDDMHHRHAQYCVTMATDHASGLRRVDDLDEMLANLTAALEWARATQRSELATRIAVVMLSHPGTMPPTALSANGT